MGQAQSNRAAHSAWEALQQKSRGAARKGRARIASSRLGEEKEGGTHIKDHMGRISIGHFLEYLPERGAGPLGSWLTVLAAMCEGISGPCASVRVC